MTRIEAAIKIAADNVQSLRVSDVFRVLEQNDAAIRKELAAFISASRPDLEDEVSESLSDLAA
ncbi:MULTISPECIES: hypothetical protein [unclassified Sinorhizobium]|uniref:hypothetical protein n=1 Tax=unclassified Sinorhizobium TaxID=2613772 RepID=UPI003523C017